MRKDVFAEMLDFIVHQHFQIGERFWLLSQMVKRPERFPVCFYSAHPADVLRFHLLVRQERLWRKALKEIIAALLEHYGYHRLDNRINVSGKTMKCDHYVLSPNGSFAVLIEQRVKDDHDSSKARRQWRENFAPKVCALYQKHDKNLIAVTYFIDPTFRKNFDIYSQEAERLKSKLNLLTIHIWYGQELFENLPFANPKDWDAIIEWLHEWRKRLPKLPEVNWETEEAITELQDIARRNPSLWEKLAMQEQLWAEGYLDVLFPTRKGLFAILNTLSGQSGRRHQKASNALRKRLGEIPKLANEC
jgi:hypothetical protein